MYEWSVTMNNMLKCGLTKKCKANAEVWTTLSLKVLGRSYNVTAFFIPSREIIQLLKPSNTLYVNLMRCLVMV